MLLHFFMVCNSAPVSCLTFSVCYWSVKPARFFKSEITDQGFNVSVYHALWRWGFQLCRVKGLYNIPASTFTTHTPAHHHTVPTPHLALQLSTELP